MNPEKKKLKKKPEAQLALFSENLAQLENWLEKNGRWVLICGWLGFLLLYFSLASDELGGVLGGDNVRYLTLAKSLALGKGYRDLLFPGEPFHTQYPFLFPLLVSPLALGARPVFYTHLFLQFLASLIPLLIAGWARLEGESRIRSVLLFFLTGLLPAYFSFLLNILSEIVFMFFMFSAFFLLSYSRIKNLDLTKVFVFSILVLACALTREQGLVLFIALFLGILLESELRQKKIAGIPFWVCFLLIFILGYGLWTLRNLGAGGGGTYYKQFFAKNPYLPQLGLATLADFMQRIQNNLFIHLPHLGGFAIPFWLFLDKKSALFPSFIFLVPIFVGIFSRLQKKRWTAELVFLALFVLALLWFYQEYRFSFTFLPLTGFYFLKGLDGLKKFFKNLEPILLTLLLLLVFCEAGFTGWLANKYRQHLVYPQEPVLVDKYGEWTEPVIDLAKYYAYWQKPEEYNVGFTDWIILQKVAGIILPENAVIVSRKAPITWYYSGRKSIWYQMGVTSEEQWKYLKQNQATHLLVVGNPELINLIKEYPDNFKLCAGIERSKMFLVEILNYP